jgi:sulfotransferase family protein
MSEKTIGPDFLCIGAQKAGTGWLYEQLREHSDFWMPPLKELHYFDRLGRARALPAGKKRDRLETARKSARDERDLRFLDAMQILSNQAQVDLPAYAALFGSKGSLLSGDITPGYSILPDETIDQIISYFPALKVIFIARDPVERAWSQLSMWVRNGLIDRSDLNEPDAVIRNLQRPEITARSYPSQIVGRWRKHVRPELFQVCFFDDLKRNAAELRRSIIHFLGGDPSKPSGNLTADHNTKARKEKLSLSDSTRSKLAQFFREELKTCATELGGAAKAWPVRYGL